MTTAWMLSEEVGTIINNLVDYDPLQDRRRVSRLSCGSRKALTKPFTIHTRT